MCVSLRKAAGLILAVAAWGGMPNRAPVSIATSEGPVSSDRRSCRGSGGCAEAAEASGGELKPAVEAGGAVKFDIPVWHPDARWKPTPEGYVGSGACGFLGGKASEAMWYGDGLSAGRCSYGSGCGPTGVHPTTRPPRDSTS